MERREDLRSLTMPFLALAAFNLLPGLWLRPLWWQAFTGILLAYRFWLQTRDGRMPPRPMIFLGVIAATVAVWQHYSTLVGDEAAGSLLGLMVALKVYELRVSRDYFVASMMCLLLLMSHALLDQSLLMTLFLLADLAFAVLLLLGLEKGQWSTGRALLPGLRPMLVLGLKSLPLMVLIFVLFPRFSTGFGANNQSKGKMGISDQLRPGSVSKLVASDELVFRATFLHGDVPPRQSLYWRGAILDQSNGLNWSRKAHESEGRVPEISGEGDVEIYLEPGLDNFIYTLDNTEFAFFPKNIRLNARRGRVFELEQPIGSRERYYLRNALSWPLEKEDPRNFLSTEEKPSERLRDFLRRLSGESPAATAAALMRHFQSQGYAYSLEPPPVETIEQFLFVTKTGFCEHYAGTMATLLRWMGVPARVVVGFQGGTPSLLDNYISVRSLDAHAWVEYYDPQVLRWRRADPTAQVDPQRIRMGGDLYRKNTAGWLQTWMPGAWTGMYAQSRALFDEVDARWSGFLLRFDLARQRAMLARLGMEGVLFRALPVFLVLGLILLLSILYFFEAQRREPMSEEQKLFVLLLQQGRRWRLSKRPNEGPTNWLARIEAEQPQLAPVLRPLFADLISIRYGHQPLTPQLKADLRLRLRRLRGLKIRRHAG